MKTSIMRRVVPAHELVSRCLQRTHRESFPICTCNV